MTAHDAVNHPAHYTSHPSGVKCLEITRHLQFNPGNAFKYVWRHGLKVTADAPEDLAKAVFYLEDHIAAFGREFIVPDEARDKVGRVIRHSPNASPALHVFLQAYLYGAADTARDAARAMILEVQP